MAKMRFGQLILAVKTLAASFFHNYVCASRFLLSAGFLDSCITKDTASLP